jgi:hypothetical protein
MSTGSIVADMIARTNQRVGFKPKPSLEQMRREAESMPFAVPYRIEAEGSVSLSKREFGKVVRWYGQTVSVYHAEVGTGEVGIRYNGVLLSNLMGVIFEPEEGIYAAAGFKEAGWSTRPSEIDVQVTFDKAVSCAEVRSLALSLVNEELLQPKEVAELPVGEAIAHSIRFLPTPTLGRVLIELARLDASSKEEWEKKLLKGLEFAEATREIVKGIKIEWIGFGQASDRDKYRMSSKPTGEEIPSSELIRKLLIKGRSGGSLIVRT